MRRVVACVLATGFLVALTASAVMAAGPVDVRGHWDGYSHVGSAKYHDTVDFKSEDFSTGKISGTAIAGTYTAAGSVSGTTVKFDLATKGYT